MSDAPGTGKTFVILALVLMLKNAAKKINADPGTNIIVVPRHIFAQWIDAASQFSDALVVREYNTFGDVTSIRDSIQGIDVLLSTREFLPLLQGIEGVHRLVLDEPPKKEEAEKRPNARMTWYVSASLRVSVVRENESCCAPDFVSKSFSKLHIAFQAPETSFLRCNNVLVTRVLSRVLEGEERQSAFAGLMTYERTKFDNASHLVKFLRSSFGNEVAEKAHQLDEVAKRRRTLKKQELEKLTLDHSALQRKLTKLRKAIFDAGVCGCCGSVIYGKGFRAACSDTDITCESCAVQDKCPWCMSNACEVARIDGLPVHAKSDANNDKMEILGRLIEKSPPDAKIVIVSAYGFEAFRNRFPDLNKDVTDDPVAFMANPSRIMLLDPILHSTGSNMHAATDIVIVHRLQADVEMQVIGRALRPPRSSRLRVWHLRYDSEHALF